MPKGKEELFRFCRTCTTKTHVDCIQQWVNASVKEHSKCIMCQQPYKLEKKQMRLKDSLRFFWYSLMHLFMWCLFGGLLNGIHAVVHGKEFHLEGCVLWFGFYISAVVWSIFSVGLLHVALFNREKILDSVICCIWVISIPLLISLNDPPLFFCFGLLGWLPPLALLFQECQNFRSTKHLTIQPL
jgi:hypothetical protein